MKVSIIIPVYNSKNTIKKCLESITNQSYKNIEILVIDNNSEDNSISIIKKIQKQDNRIKLLTEKKIGVSYARNLGIKKATGKYIMFVDSDDYLLEDAIEKMIKIINIYKCDVIRGTFQSNKKTYDNKNIYKNNHLYNKKEIENEIIPNILNQKIGSYIWLLLIKKEVLKKIDFHTKLYIHQDLVFYIELLNTINKIYFTNEIIYYYNQNDNSSKSKKYYERNIYNLLDLYQELNIFNFKKQEISNLCFSMLIPYFGKIIIDNRKLFNNIYHDIKKNSTFQDIVKNRNKKEIRIDLRIEYYLFTKSKKIYQIYITLIHLLKIKKY